MLYGSICSGIEAASVAFAPLGWECEFLAEIDKFPNAVLQHHYPEVPNFGDFTTIQHTPSGRRLDLLIGGTPCQSFSVAGLRGGLADARGNLAMEYLKLAARLRPRWLIWENVPGVMSSGRGRDFGAFLWALANLGYGFAYRVLDAQFFGVPQRRRRVFVVGYLGDWRRAAAVLFEPESLRGDSKKGRKKKEEVAGTLGGGSGNRGWSSDTDRMTFVCNAEGSEGLPSLTRANLGKTLNNQTPVCITGPIPFDTTQITSRTNRSKPEPGSHCHTLPRQGHPPAIAFHHTQAAVRRLTPRECERLQGFPDDFTLVPYRGKPAKDGPRYKALGNSMAVPVVAWIGRRIALVEGLCL